MTGSIWGSQLNGFHITLTQCVWLVSSFFVLPTQLSELVSAEEHSALLLQEIKVDNKRECSL